VSVDYRPQRYADGWMVVINGDPSRNLRAIDCSDALLHAFAFLIDFMVPPRHSVSHRT